MNTMDVLTNKKIFVYLVWNHDEKYVFPFIEKIFIDGLAAGKYVREMNEEYDAKQIELGLKHLNIVYHVQEMEAE